MDWQSEVVGQWFNCILVGDRWVDYVMMDGSVVGVTVVGCWSVGRWSVGWLFTGLPVDWLNNRHLVRVWWLLGGGLSVISCFAMRLFSVRNYS